LSANDIFQLLATTLRASCPLILAALGATFASRAGVFHLGLDGLMLFGAFGSIAGTRWTHNAWLGVLVGIAASVVASVVFWAVIVLLKADPVIAGLGMSTLGLGATSFALQAIFKSRGAIYVDEGLWRPISGRPTGAWSMISDLSVLVWATPMLICLTWVVLRRTLFGVRVSTVGEYPFAARSAGISPEGVRLKALMITGVFCGLAGAELSLGSLRSFTENLTQGRGFISFTAVIFGSASPVGVAAAGLFFGLADAIGIQSQLAANGLPLPRELILAIPYLLTIGAVWYSSVRRRQRGGSGNGFGELRDS
jgi:ABC-type uncharacterized transport system permease subunit